MSDIDIPIEDKIDVLLTKLDQVIAERDGIRHRAVELDHALTETLKLAESVQAERDRLREALEHMLAVYDKGPLKHQPHALFLARAALSKEAGK